MQYFVILSDVVGMNNTTTMKNKLITYFETFNKSLSANKAFKDFEGGSTVEAKAEFTRLKRNATRYQNDLRRIYATFNADDIAIYNSVKNAWNTFDLIFEKGK